MAEKYYLERLLQSGGFRFDKLDIDGIDNDPVFKLFGAQLSIEETALFSAEIRSGQDYLDKLDTLLRERLESGQAAPIVRFADGEYAFYAQSLSCNGLYKQAESVAAIRQAIPFHVEMLQRLSKSGWLAPLIHQGNSTPPRRGIFSFLRKSAGDGSAHQFLEFLAGQGLSLTADNYIPFYAVYAYLSSPRFADLMQDRHLCVINSTCNLDACQQWFARLGCVPRLSFVKIPDSFVATRWQEMRDEIIGMIPPDVDLCLLGAGIGALLACVDVAETLKIPAIDAGHVLNMMNCREDKSNGARMYTIWK